jgi:hypothetical protein
MNSNAAWSRFLRTHAAAANQLASDLSGGSSPSVSSASSPETLVRGPRHQAILSVPGLRSEDGVTTADIGRAIGLLHSFSNVYSALRALRSRYIVELVPNRLPQRWRLVEQFRRGESERAVESHGPTPGSRL